jgi:glycosyltransferase involved in cell wall biosynthesis
MSNEPNPQSRRARILFVDHCALMSGGEIALLNLVRTLDRLRFEPIVVLCSDGPLVAALRQAQVETHILRLEDSIVQARKDALAIGSLSNFGRLVEGARYVMSLAAFVRENRIDLVHTNSLKADILGGAAARLAGRRLIWHVRDRIADDYLPPGVVTCFRALCRLVPDVVITNSRATMQTIRDDRPEGDDHYSVVHDGVQTAFNTPRPGRSPSVPVIGLLGRISPWKGQDVFIRAAATVLRHFPAARFRIIGKVMFDETDYENQLHALVEELGIRSSVDFVGFRSDVSAALSELDLLVHASTVGEPFGQVIVEAMTAGLPVIATEGGGVPEIVLHGETGLLVPMKEVDAMASAMIHILSDPVAAREMGRKGQLRASEVFSIEKTARAVEAIYDRLLRERE